VIPTTTASPCLWSRHRSLAAMSRRGPMSRNHPITTLFVDVGGVLLTDGWDHRARRRAAAAFKMGWAEMEARHRLTFETYEEGRLTLEEYLDLVVFHRSRPFTRAEFRRFMFKQSKPFPRMIELVARLKVDRALKVVVVNTKRASSMRIGFGSSNSASLRISSCPRARYGCASRIPTCSAGAGPGPGHAARGGVHRKYAHVRPDRRRPWHSGHPSYGLRVHVHEAGSLGLQKGHEP